MLPLLWMLVVSRIRVFSSFSSPDKRSHRQSRSQYELSDLLTGTTTE